MKNQFEFKKYEYVSVAENGHKVLSVNINPEKACIFNCRICNVGTTKYQGEWHDFGTVTEDLNVLRERIISDQPDILEVAAGKGDVLTNPNLEAVIQCAHELGVKVRIMTNCYLLGIGDHMRLAHMCEEVVAGFCFTEEESFAYIHRPRPEDEFTAEKQTKSMIRFSQDYKGKFTLRVLLVKGYNDSDEQVKKLKEVVDQIKYDVLWVGTWPKFEVCEERVQEISKVLHS